MNTKTIFKSLVAIGASFNLVGLALTDAPITGEVHANSTFADSPEDLKKAYELLLEGDTQSLLQMTNEDKCAPTAKPIKVIVDELKGEYVRWHLTGHADLPCYSRPKDITVFVNGHAVNGSPTPQQGRSNLIKLGAIAFGYGSYFHLVDKRLTCLFALAMKTYAHLRGEHEAAMAEKVSF